MSTTGSLRERKKEQTRVDILRSAVDLFRERGYEETTVDDIVDAANYSRSTFFRYFGGKEDVVFGDLGRRFAEFELTLESASPASEPWLVLRGALTDVVLALLAPADDLEAACVALWFTEPALQARLTHIIAQAEQMLSRFLRASTPSAKGAEVERQVIASAVIGVAKAAVQAQLSTGESIASALARGFALLERGVIGQPA